MVSISDLMHACIALTKLDRRPTVSEVLPWVRAYVAAPGRSMGGALHIVLCDENVTDDNVAFCRRAAALEDDHEGVCLASVLRRMTRTQRLKIARSWR